MAKAKQGVDIKALALAHIEKVVLAVIVFCFLSLIWQAFRLQGMPEGHDPKAIESAAAAADSQIGSTTYIEYTQGPVVPRFDSTVMDELDGETYASPVPMNPTLETRRDRRFDPALVTAQDPEIHIDYGPFALLTAKSIERELAMQSIAAPRWLQEQMSRARRVESDLTRAQKQLPLPGVDVSDRTVAEGRRWVMVNALVPHSRQQSEYNKVFLKYDGFDAENDRPRYLGYEAQRAKVSGGEQGEWETVFRQSPTSRSMEIITFRWGKRGKLEIIDPRYVVESVTWPLGPRVLADWGERDKHSQVPLKKKEESKGEPGNEGFDPILNPNAKRQRFEEQEEKDVPHRMLRYFDFDVQPGERYRYRFRLILRDPNYIRDASYEEQAYGKHKRVAIKYLDKKVVQRIEEKKARLKAQGLSEAEIEAEMRLIYSDWSEPTETVKIPFDTRILAIDTEPALLNSPRSEPSAKVLVKEFNMETGVTAAAETVLERLGSLGNFIGQDVLVINPDTKQVDEVQYPFDTDMILLDVRGGREVIEGSGIERPGELLVVGHEGKIVVLSELDDKPAVQDHKDLYEKVERLRSAEPGKIPGTGNPIIGSGDDVFK